MQTMLSIKIDRELKKKAQDVAKALGVSLNAVINQNIKNFIEERYITFAQHPILNNKSNKLLSKLLDDSKIDRNISKPFDDINGMINALHSK